MIPDNSKPLGGIAGGTDNSRSKHRLRKFGSWAGSQGAFPIGSLTSAKSGGTSHPYNRWGELIASLMGGI
jgi:hypothetical protein